MYIIYKVTPGKENIQIDIENIVQKIGEARHYLSHLEYIIHNKDRCVITNIVETKPTEKDDDGYYVIKDIENEDHIDIYKKKTKLLEGYVYNSYEVKIEKIAFYEIKYYHQDSSTYKKSNCCVENTSSTMSNVTSTLTLPKDLIDELKTRLDLINNKKLEDIDCDKIKCE